MAYLDGKSIPFVMRTTSEGVGGGGINLEYVVTTETTVKSIAAVTSLNAITSGQIIIIKFSNDQMFGSQININLVNASGNTVLSAPVTSGLYFNHVYYAGDHAIMRYNGTTWDFLNTKTAGSISIKDEDNDYCYETVEAALHDILQRLLNCEGGTGGGTGNGYSPTIEITEITGGHRITVTDINGTNNFDVMDGRTPVKGTDYYTEADKNELVDMVLAALPAAEGTNF